MDERPVHQRCWCYRYGRCLTGCPTADLPAPVPLTDENWRSGYAEALASRREARS